MFCCLKQCCSEHLCVHLLVPRVSFSGKERGRGHAGSWAVSLLNFLRCHHVVSKTLQWTPLDHMVLLSCSRGGLRRMGARTNQFWQEGWRRAGQAWGHHCSGWAGPSVQGLQGAGAESLESERGGPRDSPWCLIWWLSLHCDGAGGKQVEGWPGSEPPDAVVRASSGGGLCLAAVCPWSKHCPPLASVSSVS